MTWHKTDKMLIMMLKLALGFTEVHHSVFMHVSKFS